jgi:predicted KAP-like P-loop ATPase
MRFSVGTLIKYRRSVRQMMLFVLLMAFFTLFLLMRTVTESTDALGEDVNKYEPGWMGPWQRRIIAWTGVGLRPTASLSDYLSQRWYLKSNFSQFVDANLLGVFNQLWPEENSQSDRIENQLLFRSLDAGSTNSTIRTIYLPEGFSGWNMDGHGKDFFRSDSCPVSACQLTTDPKTARTADAILFKHRVDASFKVKTPERLLGL